MKVSRIDAALMRTGYLDLVARFGDNVGRAIDVIADRFCTSSSREVLTRWLALDDDAKDELGRLIGLHLVRDRLDGGDDVDD